MIKKSLLLTKREIEVINKRLKNMKLTQQDSNYLSKFVRPKLREMSLLDSILLLEKLEYNQKIKAIENKIKNLILKNIKNVGSITLYGSIIYSNYTNYKDIDVLVTMKKKFWKKLGEKYKLIIKLKKGAEKKGLNLDIKIFLDEDIYKSYPSNITLIYELIDSKTIYGILSYPRLIKIDNSILKFHVDYSYSILLEIKENGLKNMQGRDLYSAIRNLWTINLITKKIVDNKILIEILNSELGENLINVLKENKASLVQKKIAYIYLEDLYERTEKIIQNITKEIKWERKMWSGL